MAAAVIFSSGSGTGLSLGMVKLLMSFGPTRTAIRAASTIWPRGSRERARGSSPGMLGPGLPETSRGVVLLVFSEAIHRVPWGVMRMARTSFERSPTATL